MKTKSKITGHIIRSGGAALFFLCALVALSSAFNSNRAPKPAVASRPAAKALSTANQARTLTFADRIAHQRAIEDVYWRHRIWPAENAQPKPSLDEVMSAEQVEKKVEDYLRDSQALETYWQKPITSEQLQAEMERMAQNTKQPEVLQELFEALGNDPLLIAECLARQVFSGTPDRRVNRPGQRPALSTCSEARPPTANSRVHNASHSYNVPEI